MAAFAESFDANSPAAFLARLKARFRAFDAVVHGVAYQMDEWIGYRIDQQFVELNIPADNFEIDFLSGQARGRSAGTHCALERRAQ